MTRQEVTIGTRHRGVLLKLSFRHQKGGSKRSAERHSMGLSVWTNALRWSDSDLRYILLKRAANYGDIAMRKAILMMLLAVVSSSAAAEWVEVYPHDANFTNYADPASISKAGDIVTMWSMSDRKERPSNKYGSVKFLIEYDCKKEQYRMLDTSYHSGNMGGGAENHEKNVRPYWKPVRRGRGGIFEAKWMVACGKR